MLPREYGQWGASGNGVDVKLAASPREALDNVPAIVFTAFAREDKRQQALESGFQHHISKPIEPQQWVNAIAQALPQSTSQ
jgi:hypothetical protein